MTIANHFIVLNNHLDHLLQGFLLYQADFIKANFTTVMAECVPSGLKNAEVIDYLLNINVTYQVGIEGAAHMKGVTPEDVKFMSTPIVPVQDKMKFIDEKIRIMRLIFNQVPLQDQLLFLHGNQFLANFKRIKFYEKLLSLGLELVGCEPKGYQPGRGVFNLYNRDESMIDILMKHAKEGKRIFADLGALHGIGLYEKLKGTPHEDYFSIVRLSVNPDTINPEGFSAWLKEHPLETVQLPNVNLRTVLIPLQTDLEAGKKLLSDAATIDIQGNKNALAQYQRGILLFKNKSYQNAISHLEHAATLFESKDLKDAKDSKDLKDKKGEKESSDSKDAKNAKDLQLATCYSTIASCYRDMDDLDKAKLSCEKALAICTEKKLPETSMLPFQVKLNGILEKQAEKNKPSPSSKNALG